MQTAHLLLLSSMIGGVLPHAATAQNANVNGEFGVNTAGWIPGGASNAMWSHADGSPDYGSIQLSSVGTGPADLATQCALLNGALAGVTSFDMGARVKFVQNVLLGTVRFDFFGSTTCTGLTGTAGPAAAMSATNGYLDVYRTAFARPAGTNSVLITLTVQSSSSSLGIARFDHVYIGGSGNACTAETTGPSVASPGGVSVTQGQCQ